MPKTASGRQGPSSSRGHQLRDDDGVTMGRKRKSRARYGSGSVFQRGKTFTIKWREHGRQKSKGGFTSRELAEQALAAIINGVSAPAREEAPDDSAKLGELVQAWIDKRMANRSIHRAAPDEKNRWNAYLKSELSHLKPREVKPPLLMSIVVELRGKGLAGNTANNALRALSSFYSDLIPDGSFNPVRAIPRKFRKKYLADKKEENRSFTTSAT